MKVINSIGAALFALLFCGFIFTPPPTFVPTSSGGCSAATTFLARTSGLSGTETTAYTTMICGMVTDGTWSLLDTFYIFATNTQTTALLNLPSTSFGGTTHGTVSFSADHGYTGDGSTFYIDTGWKPTNGSNYAQNSASFGAYQLNSSTTAGGHALMGEDAISEFDIIINAQSTTGNATVYVNSTNQPTVTNANRQGSYLISRTSSSAFSVYKNESLVTSPTSTSAAPSAANLYILANNSGSPNLFSADQIAAAFTGGGLNSTQAGNVQSRINAYMTALGINVY